MPLFDFRCPAGHTVELMASSHKEYVKCDECGRMAKKVILAAPRLSWLHMGAQKNASPEAKAKFHKLHNDRKIKEERTYREHGDYGRGAGGD